MASNNSFGVSQNKSSSSRAKMEQEVSNNYETSKIKGHSYVIQVTDTLYVADYNYPLAGASNFEANHLEAKLTSKRVVVEDWISRDNWNGSGITYGDKVFFDDRDELKALKQEAKQILQVADTDDKDYEVMEFVTKVFNKFGGYYYE